MRKTIDKTAPWMPWLIPSTIGALDAANLIGAIVTPLYDGLIVGAATITILIRGPRTVRDMLAERWERAAAQAQVREAALLAYRMHAEHCETHRQVDTGELRQAVGSETTASIPSLHVVRTPDDGGDGHEAVFRHAATIGRAAVPQQGQPSVRLATARRLRPDA